MESRELSLEDVQKLPEPAAKHEVSQLPLAQSVLAHWQEFRPKMCAALEKEKKLYRAVLVAAHLTAELHQSLWKQGLPPDRVRELADREYYRLPDEQEQPSLTFDPSSLPASMETSA